MNRIVGVFLCYVSMALQGMEWPASSPQHIDIKKLAQETKRSAGDIKKLLAWNFTEQDIRNLHIRNIDNPLEDPLIRNARKISEFDLQRMFNTYHDEPANLSALLVEVDYLLLIPAFSLIADINRLVDRRHFSIPLFTHLLVPTRSAPDDGWGSRAAALLTTIPGWNPNVVYDKECLAPLHHAIGGRFSERRGSPYLTSLLLALPTTEVNLCSKQGLTPLHIAILQGSVDLVQLLLNHPNIDLTLRVGQGQMPESSFFRFIDDPEIFKKVKGKTPLELVEFVKDKNQREKIRELILNKQKQFSLSEEPIADATANFQAISSFAAPFIIPSAPKEVIEGLRKRYERRPPGKGPSWDKPFEWIYENPRMASAVAAMGLALSYMAMPGSESLSNLEPDVFFERLKSLLYISAVKQAYRLAQLNAESLVRLSSEQLIHLKQRISALRGEVIEAHQKAAMSWPVMRSYKQWRLGDETETLKILSDLEQYINKATQHIA